jgi:hypothetical protein
MLLSQVKSILLDFFGKDDLSALYRSIITDLISFPFDSHPLPFKCNIKPRSQKAEEMIRSSLKEI